MFSEVLRKYIAATADGIGACAVQMANKIAIKKLPTASITLLGSGIMHWSKDKQIDVIQGTPPPTLPPPLPLPPPRPLPLTPLTLPAAPLLSIHACIASKHNVYCSKHNVYCIKHNVYCYLQAHLHWVVATFDLRLT